MYLIPLTPMGSHFIRAEIIERYLDDLEKDERPELYAAMEIVNDHMERSGGRSLAVVPHLDEAILEVINALDDAIEHKRTEKEFGLDGRAARALHKSGQAIWTQVFRYLRASGRATGTSGRSSGALVYVDRNGVPIVKGQRVRFRVGTGYLNAREGTGVVHDTIHHTVQITSDEPISYYSTRWSDPAVVTRQVSVGTNLDHRRGVLVAGGGSGTVDTWVEVIPKPKRKRSPKR